MDKFSETLSKFTQEEISNLNNLIHITENEYLV